jgi:hypothetical protein
LGGATGSSAPGSPAAAASGALGGAFFDDLVGISLGDAIPMLGDGIEVETGRGTGRCMGWIANLWLGLSKKMTSFATNRAPAVQLEPFKLCRS